MNIANFELWGTSRVYKEGARNGGLPYKTGGPSFGGGLIGPRLRGLVYTCSGSKTTASAALPGKTNQMGGSSGGRLVPFGGLLWSLTCPLRSPVAVNDVHSR